MWSLRQKVIDRNGEIIGRFEPTADISNKLSGITCGKRGTSCADQLAKAVVAGYEASLDPNYVSPLEDE